MKQNIKIAKELLKLAKELSATFFETTQEKGEWEHVNGMEASMLIKHLDAYLKMLISVDEQKQKLLSFSNQMQELEDECEIVIDRYRELDAAKNRLSISNDQNKYQKVQNDYREVEKEAEELNDNLTGINSVLVRINRALRRYELCQILMQQVSEEAKSTLATFKKVYGNDFLDDDLKIKEEFEKFIQDKNYQLIIQESKQKGDVAFADFIQETKEIKRIGQKLWETLKIAGEMTKVQQMYITSVDKDVRTIKAFVGNNSTFVQLLVDKTKQIEEKNQTKQAAIGDWKDKFIDWITKAVNNVKSFFTNLNNKIKDFFNKNNEGLEALENKLTELENALK